MNLMEALTAATERLRPVSPSPKLDAELLLRTVIRRSASFLRTWPETPLGDDEAARFFELVTRRANGEPVAYLLGEREFWSMRLLVGPQTLIPRPETELLVELALARIPEGARWRLADLGTGTGAIALALAQERPECELVATDIAVESLALARANAERLQVKHLDLRQGSWFEPLAGERFQLIASNPPYIDAADPHLSQGDVRFEPRRALVAGERGLADLRRIVSGAPGHLSPGGHLLVEHGFDQGEAVAALFAGAGFVEVERHRDFGGNERVVSGRWPGRDRGTDAIAERRDAE